MRVSVELFPDTGHHLYFVPIAVPSGGTPEANEFRETQKLPSLSSSLMERLTALCTLDPDWMQAGSRDKSGKSEIAKGPAWLRGKFGIKKEPLFAIFGIWCAVETNTGTRGDGYTWDIDDRPAADDAGWRAWQRNPDQSTPYVHLKAEKINFDKPEAVNLVKAFDLEQKIGGSIGEFILEVRWQRPDGKIPVHLIVDFGNSRTIVFGLEIAEDKAKGGLKDICRPILFKAGEDDARSPIFENISSSELVPDSWIILKEPPFSGADFVPPRAAWAQYLSEPGDEPGFVKSLAARLLMRGRPQGERLGRIIKRVPYMFLELSPALIGSEATHVLSGVDTPGGQLTFLSSPKRYAWDDDPVGTGGGLPLWSMHSRTGHETRPLAGEMFRFLPRRADLRRWIMNETNPSSPTEWEDARRPHAAPRADFGRADSLIWTALAIIERAGRQIQSEAWRGSDPMPRYLDHIVVTFPPGWTNQEYLAYRTAWYLATQIYYWSRGSAAGESRNLFKRPGLSLDLDEAISSQLAVVFSEIHHLGDRAKEWIELYGRVRGEGKSVRVLAIDIGGGTLDTAVVEYRDKAPPGSGVRLVLEVLFNDSSTIAGDKLVKDLIEGVLLPRLGQRFHADPAKKAQFERLLEGRQAVGIQNRFQPMVFTRTIFIPMVFKWLEDCALLRDKNPATNNFWTPQECGADQHQIDKLNEVCRKTRLIGPQEYLLTVNEQFDVDYQRISEIINHWCKPIADIHARYVAALQCDFVIVTGKPSELPQIRGMLEQRLPIGAERMVFASGYYAGRWFPATTNGKIPDAKMVTVIGATIYQALQNNLIPNWHIDEVISHYRPPRNYWGIASHVAAPFGDDSVLLAPDKDTVTRILPTNCVLGRARFPHNVPEPVYVLRWRDREVRAQRGNRLVHVKIERVTSTSTGGRLRTEYLRLADVEPYDNRGDAVSPDDLELRLRTLPQDEGHWLDQGQFAVKW